MHRINGDDDTVIIENVVRWWCTPLTSTFGRQRQADLCGFKGSLVYTASSRIARATNRNPVSEKKRTKNVLTDYHPN